ncbi:aryl-alcohol oxidase-like protein [Irpex rosettiformis]|uniref:Aryl-alcohol oxidase-like protein n=1 Tax=Irpex rosettiformis TaxID=378272 RepID=A0ACB8TZX9_9APHY|nr:aryl-alcohol oxidase-like protein [Irpex rosettiformis]
MAIRNTLAGSLAIAACVIPAAFAAILQSPTQLSSKKSYDYIIVGGGAGGSVLANRLTEDNYTNVLLIEAGSSDYKNLNIAVPQLAAALARSEFDWNFTTAGQPGLNGRSIPYQRGHVLGGSTAVNYMAFNTGSRDDWDRWANVTGDSGWGFDNIVKYIKKMENFVPPLDGRNISDEVDVSIHGHSGPLHISVSGAKVATDDRVINTTRELPSEFPFNLDQNSGDSLGIGWTQVTIADGERQSAALSYLDPILSRKNLDILVNTQATKVLQTGVSGGKPVFRGVQFSQVGSGKFTTLKATREVILSAGAIKTPHVLMLSGIGDSSELSKFNVSTIVDLPDVGKNLQDHPLVTSPFRVNSTDTLDNLNNATFVAEQLALWQKNRTGELGVATGSQLGWLRLPDNSSIFETEPDPSAGPTSAHFEFILIDSFIDFSAPPPGNYFTGFTVLVSSSSRGYITLNTTNPFDPPFIQPSFLSTPFDIFTMRESIKSMRRFMAAPAWDGWILNEFGSFAAAQTDEQIEEYARNTTVTVNHVTCTVGMGKTGSSGPGTGALNADLTVKGTVGLRVVDASAFPFIPAAHPQGVTYALAERAADLIKGVSTC